MVPHTTTTTLGYARVSTEEQAREGLSLAAQQDRIRAYCATQGLPLTEVLVDAGVGGKSLDRPQLQELLARVREGAVGTVVIVRLDRLSRRTRDLLELGEDVFTTHKVELVSLTESLDTRTPAGRLMLTLLGGLAQLERELIGDRTRAALAFKKARGDRLGGTPLGYRTPRPGAPMEPIEEELATVGMILRQRAAGASYAAIAKELKREGRATKRGGRWHPSTIRAVCQRGTISAL